LVNQSRSLLIETYLERRGDLVRFFTFRLKSPSAAEDLVQDMFVRISGAGAPAEVQSPVGYLYRLGSNLMLDRLRGERRSAAREVAWRQAHHSAIGADDVAEEPAADDAVAARQRLSLVVEALKDLSPQTQRVFRMHKFDGFSHPEVAQALGISRSAVEKHIMAALKHLLAKLS
jgi:RNA polymerase sigma-70 factor (ECF subfamily)